MTWRAGRDEATNLDTLPAIQPLVSIEGWMRPVGEGADMRFKQVYKATCRECGEVTEHNQITLEQAGLAQRRHLAKHLTALALEIEFASR